MIATPHFDRLSDRGARSKLYPRVLLRPRRDKDEKLTSGTRFRFITDVIQLTPRTRRRPRRAHADAPTSRRNPSCGFGRDLDASARSSTPPERIAFDPHQHLSPSRAHRDRLRRRSRARRAENSRGAVKKKARAIRASNARRVSKP